MPDVGDVVTARLTVSPADVTTVAVLTVTGPDGSSETPTVSGEGAGTEWSAPVWYTLAGVWRLSWTVMGTGASVQHQVVSVAPTPATTVAGRSYATTTQLANYLDAAPPLDAARLLARATQLLDAEVLRAAWYDTDDGGMPTNAQVIAAFAEATCAQVEFWGEVGEETDTAGPVQGVSIGSAQIQYGAGDNRTSPTTIGDRVYRALAVLPASVFRMGVSTSGCGGW